MFSAIRDAWERALHRKAAGDEKKQLALTRANSEQAILPIASVAPQAVPAADGEVAELPSRSVTVSKDPVFRVRSARRRAPLLAVSVEDAGKRLQVSDHAVPQRELTLGLDFGTSCSKIIIGDAAAGKSFAIPFHEGVDIERYLLASRVYETDGTYSLVDGPIVHRDLKLSFIDGSKGDNGERRVVAFLALAIRRARGWLFQAHRDVYLGSSIVWRLTIGLPTRQNLDRRLSDRFRYVALASWYVAGDDGPVNRSTIDRALVRAVEERGDSMDVDVQVMPEIAAQIYGFVVSDSFDRLGRNIYLMADIGSGTVDASLFHVKEEKGRRHAFSFYTSTVEHNGVSNLHRHRGRWWMKVLQEAEVEPTLIRELDDSMEVTDHDLRIPEDFRDYFDGIAVNGSSVGSPDDDFFRGVERQVVADTFIRAVRDNQAPQQQLVDVPFYLCGGGSRMRYYAQLKQRLERPSRNFGVSATGTPLPVPEDLDVPGVAGDYDRLSVAYGLAWLDPAWVVETEPMSPIDAAGSPGWRDNYIDKDQL
ncbi:hypothetical protein GCM10007164_02460 [Luteimonas padinae]|nr:hypothetical protein GCM10007164_02460 [Luteimonas padinae]